MLALSAPVAASLITLLLVGCSGSSQDGGKLSEAGGLADAPSHDDVRSSEGGDFPDTSPGVDVRDGGPTVMDAPPDVAPPGDAASPVDSSGAGSGPCASCTASKCLTELEACAGSSTCTDALVAFNSCFTAPSLGTSCGAAFATQGPEAAALWACMSAMCKPTCS